MDLWLANIIFSLGISILLTGVIIPQILLIAFRKKLFDVPDERKIHKSAVPRLGGIAFMPAIFFSVTSVCGFAMLYEPSQSNSIDYQWIVQFCFISCSIMLMFLVGLADDLVGVKYRAKFVVQIISAIMLVAGGLWIDNLHGFMWIHELSPFIGVPLTILVIVFIINAINLIDGIDGLASGLSFAALIIYGTAFFFMKAYIFAVISFAVVGVLIPFFYYNVFGDAKKRKKIFMGDTGSLTIGLILAYLSLELYCISMVYGSELRANPFIVAFCPLLIPCLDVVRVFMGRIRRHNNPFLPDKTHIHHKLLAIGIPPRLCMVTIVTVALFTSTLNIYLSQYIDVNILVLLDIGGWTAGNILLSKRINKINANSN